MLNKKFKVLLIGDVNSIYIQKYAKELHKREGITFDVFSLVEPTILKPSYIRNIFTPKYRETNIRFIKKIRKLFATYRLSKEVIRSNKYDIIHVHYLSYLNVLVMPVFRTKIPKVVSMWGSDLFVDPKSFVKRFLEKRVLRKMDIVQLATKKMKEEFENSFGKKYKIRFARFGSPIDYEKIDSLSIFDIEQFKSKYGIPKDKVSVVCAYSARPQQNHKYIIDELTKLPRDILDKISVVIPLTYGEEFYRKKIVEYAKVSLKNKCPLSFLTDFLSDREMACLRKSTDVMVNIQTTDALSASMEESLYAGAVVINGSWLPYDLLYENGVFTLKLDKMQNGNLSRKISFVVKNFKELKEKSFSNKEIIKRISSWENNISDWIKIYEEVLNRSLH